jgi:hypothetical protein
MVAKTEPRENRADRSADLKKAVSAYAQSEKVKSGLIWICQIADQVAAMNDPGRRRAVPLLRTLVLMVADEAVLAARHTGDIRWHDIARTIKMALVMIDSGVPQETSFHLTRALTRVTRIGGQAAEVLRQNRLF